MSKLYKIKTHSVHPRQIPMAIEQSERGEILVHSYRRDVAITFKVDESVLKSVKDILKSKQTSIDLLLYVLSDFKDQKDDVINLFDEVINS